MLVQVKDEFFVLDDAKLEEGAREYLRSYLPDDISDVSKTDLMDERQQREIGKLEDQIKEIREERIELVNELALYRTKLNLSGRFTELNVPELEEEVAHLTHENLECRANLKQLAI